MSWCHSSGHGIMSGKSGWPFARYQSKNKYRIFYFVIFYNQNFDFEVGIFLEAVCQINYDDLEKGSDFSIFFNRITAKYLSTISVKSN